MVTIYVCVCVVHLVTFVFFMLLHIDIYSTLPFKARGTPQRTNFVGCPPSLARLHEYLLPEIKEIAYALC